MIESIPQNVYDELIRSAKKCDIKKIILFGSRARGDYIIKSDIDLFCYPKSSVSFRRFKEEVDKIHTLLSFDILNAHSDMLSLNLLDSIKKEGVVLYEEV